MKLLHAVRKPENSARKLRYRNLSLVKLVEKIAGKSDRLALEEFHNHRTLFTYGDRPPLLFIDYLNELRKSTERRTWIAPNAVEVADKAYDLTTDKFNNLPGKAKSKRDPNLMRPKGADCRLYFKAFLRRAARSFETEPPANEIEEEARAAMIMKGLVSRHFYLSLLEAERKANPFWSRYYWSVKGGTICVWLPVSLRGRERRAWLEKNIDNPDPRREEERQQIQSIIYQKLARERFVPFTKDADVSSNEEKLLPWSDSGKTFGKFLAEVVAEEKTGNIQRQRRQIRALGKEKLQRLVLRIFNDISSNKYEDGKVARDYGLAKSTFSRFAGSRWLQTRSIPDLWLNTAEALSTHPTFKEVAVSTGVWKQVQTTLETGAPRCGEEASHD